MRTALLAFVLTGCFDCEDCPAMTRVDLNGARAEGTWRVDVVAGSLSGGCEIGGPGDDSGAVCDPMLSVERRGDDLRVVVEDVFADRVKVRVTHDGRLVADRAIDTGFVVNRGQCGCDYANAEVELP